MIEALQGLGNVLLLLLVVPLVTFILLYRAWSPWRADALGIAFMSQKVMILALVGVGVLGVLLPEELDLFRHIFRLIVLLGALVLLTIDVVNLRRVQSGSSRPLLFSGLRKHYSRRK